MSLCVDDVAAKAPIGHECRITDGFASTLQERARVKRCWNEESLEDVELFRLERPLAFEIRPQRIKCRHEQRRRPRLRSLAEVYAAGLRATRRPPSPSGVPVNMP
jgi:hypothetical protein